MQMPLKLTLKPGEKFVLNGGVLINGDRRADLIIENQVSLLRERDVLQANDANTPVKRIYFSIMMMYLDGGLESGYYSDFTEIMTDFMSILSSTDALAKCQRILDEVHQLRFYTALMTCKSLLPFEKERLEYVVQ